MADFRKILNRLAVRVLDRRGVTSSEYAILAIAIVIVVGAAIRAFDLNNPIVYMGINLTTSQSSLSATAR